MTRMGSLLFYDVPTDFRISEQELREKGFGSFFKGTSYKSAFISALKRVYKDKDKFYRVFNDSSEQDNCFFGCFLESRSEQDVEIHKEIVFDFNKKTGVYRVTNESLTEAQEELVSRIDKEFKKEIVTLNSEQFRTVIKRILKESFAVSIKKGSSVHFLDKGFDTFRDKILEIPKHFPEVKIHCWPHNECEEAIRVVEESVKEDVFADLETTIANLKKEVDGGTITNKKITNKRKELDKIVSKVKAHAHNLRAESVKIFSKLSKYDDELAKYEERAEALTFDVMEELARI